MAIPLILGDYAFKAGLKNRQLTGIENIDLLRIVVCAQNPMTEFRQTSTCDQSNVSRTYNGYVHVNFSS